LQVKKLQVGERKISMISSTTKREMRQLISALKAPKNKHTMLGLLVRLLLLLVRARSPSWHIKMRI